MQLTQGGILLEGEDRRFLSAQGKKGTDERRMILWKKKNITCNQTSKDSLMKFIHR